MKTSLIKFLLSTITIASVSGAVVPIERRKDFYTTHEEHGHLPGPRNPVPTAILDQFLRILKGDDPATIMNGYNKKADKEKGLRFGRATPEDAGAVASLGFGDIPFIRKL